MSSQNSDIPKRMVKENADIFADILCKSINSTFQLSIFPNFLNRQVSILPTLSNVFKRIMFAQISAFFDNFLSITKCGFRKGYITQQCLLIMLEKLKKFVNKGKLFVALLTDFSKAFDCLEHELLTAKLNTYGFNPPALRLVHDYLPNRKQRITTLATL